MSYIETARERTQKVLVQRRSPKVPTSLEAWVIASPLLETMSALKKKLNVPELSIKV